MKTERNAKPAAPRLLLVSLASLVLAASLASAGSGPAVGLSAMPLAEIPDGAFPPATPAVAERFGDDVRGEDPRARTVALAALGDREGTVIVMDPHSGSVLTIVNQEWGVRRGFAPASTAKLVTALAALGAGGFDPAARVAAQGARVDLDDAIALSNTEYFQRAGERAGSERFLATARALGLGAPTGVNVPGEYAGRLPEGAVPAKLFGAGEGIEVTPIQLAVLGAAIANGGNRVVPFVPRRGDPYAPPVAVAVPAADLRALVPGMVGAVRYGTGAAAARENLTIAGKTGTALVPEGQLGLFVSFAPIERPALVVVVVTRGKGESGRTAAEVAGRIYAELMGC